VSRNFDTVPTEHKVEFTAGKPIAQMLFVADTLEVQVSNR
jgi:hypothetical protein